LPGTSSKFGRADGCQINNAGQVAFLATYAGQFVPGGIYMGSGDALSRVAAVGQLVPGTSIPFAGFANPPVIDDTGYATFVAQYNQPTQSAKFGLFRGNGTDLSLIAGRGDPAPGSNGVYSDVSGNYIAANNTGQVCFVGSISGATDGSNGRNLFCVDGSAVRIVANASTSLPGGNGSFSEFVRPLVNENGDIAFLANLAGTSGGTADNYGLFVKGADGSLVTVARKGDPLFGSTIASLSYTGGNAGQTGLMDSFNDSGQLAFWFILADGRQGTAVYSLPEPGSLGAAAVLLIALRRRERCG
jgi:hypothetical protein